MNQQSPNIETLEDSRQWRLYFRIGAKGFDALLFNPAPDQPMRCVSHKLAPEADLLPALEAFVYDNPLLLSDFGSVTVAVETPHFVLTPQSVKSGDMAHEILAESFPEGTIDGTAVNDVTNCLTATPINVTFQLEEKLLTFLRRTFHNPKIVHHLTPLLNYFASRRKEGNYARTYVQVSENSIDIIIFRESAVGLCNRFSYNDLDDAVYYILAARQSVGDLDPDKDEIYLCGDRNLRLQLTGRLEKFVKNILPVIFPPALFRKAREVMDAPFDLILMPICE